MEKYSNEAIGIDLGTTFSCVGLYRNNNVEIIKNTLGENITPSVVFIGENEHFVGQKAINFQLRNQSNTIYDTKRLIGKKYNDKNVQEEIKHLLYKVIKNNETGEPMIEINKTNGHEKYSIEEISQIILSQLKNDVEIYTNKKIKDAVITVPAYFNELQRHSTKIAAETAGLNILRIINEPTAAAIAYGLINENKNMKDRNVLIFDLGGGTFDVTILLLSSEGIVIVKSTNGNSHLGGEDFTNKLVDYCIREFKKNKNIDLIEFDKKNNNKKAQYRVRNKCEEAKKDLSSVMSTNIDIDNIANGEDLNITITRTDFEEMCNEYFKDCITCINNAIIDANLTKEDIEDIVLVGGSSRIPKIKKMVQEFFKREILLKNITVNPQEAIAIGATYLANTIKRNIKDESLELLDIIGMSLGVEIYGGKMEIILKKGTNIPFSKSKKYTTDVDDQESIFFKVYQGENEDDISKNYFLNEFSINNIKKGKAGNEVFEVIFTIDNYSCLNVTAKNVKSGETVSVNKIDRFSRLNEKKIKEMIKREEKRKIEREESILDLKLRNSLISLFIDEKNRGNKIAFELFEDLQNDKRKINAVIYNIYMNHLYPEH